MSAKRKFSDFFFGFFSLLFIRRLLTWFYHRKIVRNEAKLTTLRKKKTKILNEVMETETYKVAKEILEKYAPEQLHDTKPMVNPVQLIFYGS